MTAAGAGRLGLAAGAAYCLWALAFVWRSSFVAMDGLRYFALFDDAMISMRYAWNLAHGKGLVWNPGERVEGYSNLLMTLLMAVPARLLDRSGAVAAVQVLGIALLLGVALLAAAIARRLLPDAHGEWRGFVGLAAFAATLAYYPLSYWTLMGMETGLVALCLLAAVAEALRARTEGGPRPSLVAVWLGLGYLARPDTAVFALVVLVWLAAERRGAGAPAPRRALGEGLAIYATVVAAQLAFRSAYYGRLVPNTYALKLTGMPWDVRLADGIAFVGPFLVETGPLLAVAAVGLWRDARPGPLLLGLLGLGAVAYQVSVGGDAWDRWRFLAPVMPLLSIVFLLSVVSLAASPLGATSRPDVSRARMLLVALATVLALFAAERRFLGEALLVVRPFQWDANRAHVDTAIALRAVTTPEASVGVFWAGTLPYFADRPAIDFLGKCDPVIARLAPDITGAAGWAGMRSVPGHNKYDLDYSIKQRRPTYAEGFAWASGSVEDWARRWYARAEYRGVSLRLFLPSPHVRWELLTLSGR